MAYVLLHPTHSFHYVPKTDQANGIGGGCEANRKIEKKRWVRRADDSPQTLSLAELGKIAWPQNFKSAGGM